jgi:KDO2-lipid IV(A) lauroyltransferase
MRPVLKKLKLIRYFIEYLFIAFFCHFVRFMPRRTTLVLAWLGGTFLYCVPMFKKLVVSNLKVAFPEKGPKELNRIAHASFMNSVLCCLDFSWFSDSPDQITKYVPHPVIHDKCVEENLKKGSGLIICTGHLGNWDLEGLSYTTHFPEVPFAVIARTYPNPFLAGILAGARKSLNNVVIASKGAVKEMIKHLKRGYFFATLTDQNTRVRNGGLFVNFFGLPVPTSRTPAMFARKMDVPLVVTFCIRHGCNYEMIFEDLPKKLEEYKDDQELMQALMDLTEKYVRLYPEQYLWFYKRFQNIPREASPELIKKYPYYSAIADEKFYFKKIDTAS